MQAISMTKIVTSTFNWRKNNLNLCFNAVCWWYTFFDVTRTIFLKLYCRYNWQTINMSSCEYDTFESSQNVYLLQQLHVLVSHCPPRWPTYFSGKLRAQELVDGLNAERGSFNSRFTTKRKHLWPVALYRQSNDSREPAPCWFATIAESICFHQGVHVILHFPK